MGGDASPCPPCEALFGDMVWLPDWKWKQQQKKGGGKGRGGEKMVMVPLSMLQGGGFRSKKGFGKGKGRKGGQYANKVHAENKLWIGGLPNIEDREKRKEASKQLFELLKKKGTDCKFAEIWPKGVGVACYRSEDAAQSAIAELSGTKFKGKALESDSWEKKEKA